MDVSTPDLCLLLPQNNNNFYTLGRTYQLHPELLFLFGSNTAGRHGAGAALHARQHYGAVYGQGFGIQGRSFAIPTKDHQLRVLSLSKIKYHVDEFLEQILEYQDHYFYVTPIGTGLAGYDHSQIAPMFQSAVNCWLPSVWRPFL